MEGVTVKIKFFGGLLVAVGCALALQPAGAATVTLSGTGTGSDGALGASAVFTTTRNDIEHAASLEAPTEPPSG